MASNSSSSEIEIWVRDQYRQRCCDEDGKPSSAKPFDVDLRKQLFDLRPDDKKLIKDVIKKINQELYEMTPQQFGKLLSWVKIECRRFPLDERGQLQDKKAVTAELLTMRPDYHPSRIDQAVRIVQKSGIKAYGPPQSKDNIPVPIHTPTLAAAEAFSAEAFSAEAFSAEACSTEAFSTDVGLEPWVNHQFWAIGFKPKGGFIGYKKLLRKLHGLKPEHKNEISSIFDKLRQPGHEFSFGDLELAAAAKRSNKIGGTPPDSNWTTKTSPGDNSTEFISEVIPKYPHLPEFISSASSTPYVCEINGVTDVREEPVLPAFMKTQSQSAIPNGKQQITSSNRGITITSKLPSRVGDCAKTENCSRHPQTLTNNKPPSRLSHQQNLLLIKRSTGDGDYRVREESNYDIRNAVLVSASIVEETDEKTLPQYGLLGSFHPDSFPQLNGPEDDRIFVNTNIPFSAFICGVQGSGKSHTTSCLLENCLISSPMLGDLVEPLSALVFHFSEFTSRASYNPSEAAYLSVAHRDFPDHRAASYTTVMVPPSNYYNLSQLYTRIPKVKVHPFKLKPHMLDVGTMLELMAVDQSKDKSLYMAQVTKTLRDIATERNGDFDYHDFKQRLNNQNFDRTQREFLNQRLDLLESFLDLKSSSTDLVFGTSGVTIIDMSCPFVDSNTACVLFKIAMKKYLESSVAGKMIVLDEAHKYMIDTPAAAELNEFLLTVIRQQRHFGVRVIVSTQEPTISTKLIDLCAITVIHRFTSPDWFRALKTHISISSSGAEGEDEKTLFRNIVNLRTGEALVYAPTAALGKDLAGKLVKATEELLKVNIRKRVTWDGGQSVVCVK